MPPFKPKKPSLAERQRNASRLIHKTPLKHTNNLRALFLKEYSEGKVHSFQEFASKMQEIVFKNPKYEKIYSAVRRSGREISRGEFVSNLDHFVKLHEESLLAHGEIRKESSFEPIEHKDTRTKETDLHKTPVKRERSFTIVKEQPKKRVISHEEKVRMLHEGVIELEKVIENLNKNPSDYKIRKNGLDRVALSYRPLESDSQLLSGFRSCHVLSTVLEEVRRREGLNGRTEIELEKIVLESEILGKIERDISSLENFLKRNSKRNSKELNDAISHQIELLKSFTNNSRERSKGAMKKAAGAEGQNLDYTPKTIGDKTNFIQGQFGARDRSRSIFGEPQERSFVRASGDKELDKTLVRLPKTTADEVTAKSLVGRDKIRSTSHEPKERDSDRKLLRNVNKPEIKVKYNEENFSEVLDEIYPKDHKHRELIDNFEPGELEELYKSALQKSRSEESARVRFQNIINYEASKAKLLEQYADNPAFKGTYDVYSFIAGVEGSQIEGTRKRDWTKDPGKTSTIYRSKVMVKIGTSSNDAYKYLIEKMKEKVNCYNRTISSKAELFLKQQGNYSKSLKKVLYNKILEYSKKKHTDTVIENFESISRKIKENVKNLNLSDFKEVTRIYNSVFERLLTERSWKDVSDSETRTHFIDRFITIAKDARFSHFSELHDKKYFGLAKDLHNASRGFIPENALRESIEDYRDVAQSFSEVQRFFEEQVRGIMSWVNDLIFPQRVCAKEALEEMLDEEKLHKIDLLSSKEDFEKKVKKKYQEKLKVNNFKERVSKIELLQEKIPDAKKLLEKMHHEPIVKILSEEHLEASKIVSHVCSEYVDLLLAQSGIKLDSESKKRVVLELKNHVEHGRGKFSKKRVETLLLSEHYGKSFMFASPKQVRKNLEEFSNFSVIKSSLSSIERHVDSFVNKFSKYWNIGRKELEEFIENSIKSSEEEIEEEFSDSESLRSLSEFKDFRNSNKYSSRITNFVRKKFREFEEVLERKKLTSVMGEELTLSHNDQKSIVSEVFGKLRGNVTAENFELELEKVLDSRAIKIAEGKKSAVFERKEDSLLIKMEALKKRESEISERISENSEKIEALRRIEEKRKELEERSVDAYERYLVPTNFENPKELEKIEKEREEIQGEMKKIGLNLDKLLSQNLEHEIERSEIKKHSEQILSETQDIHVKPHNFFEANKISSHSLSEYKLIQAKLLRDISEGNLDISRLAKEFSSESLQKIKTKLWDIKFGKLRKGTEKDISERLLARRENLKNSLDSYFRNALLQRMLQELVNRGHVSRELAKTHLEEFERVTKGSLMNIQENINELSKEINNAKSYSGSSEFKKTITDFENLSRDQFGRFFLFKESTFEEFSDNFKIDAEETLAFGEDCLLHEEEIEKILPKEKPKEEIDEVREEIDSYEKDSEASEDLDSSEPSDGLDEFDFDAMLEETASELEDKAKDSEVSAVSSSEKDRLVDSYQSTGAFREGEVKRIIEEKLEQDKSLQEIESELINLSIKRDLAKTYGNSPAFKIGEVGRIVEEKLSEGKDRFEISDKLDEKVNEFEKVKQEIVEGYKGDSSFSDEELEGMVNSERGKSEKEIRRSLNNRIEKRDHEKRELLLYERREEIKKVVENLEIELTFKVGVRNESIGNIFRTFGNVEGSFLSYLSNVWKEHPKDSLETNLKRAISSFDFLGEIKKSAFYKHLPESLSEEEKLKLAHSKLEYEKSKKPGEISEGSIRSSEYGLQILEEFSARNGGSKSLEKLSQRYVSLAEEIDSFEKDNKEYSFRFSKSRSVVPFIVEEAMYRERLDSLDSRIKDLLSKLDNETIRDLVLGFFDVLESDRAIIFLEKVEKLKNIWAEEWGAVSEEEEIEHLSEKTFHSILLPLGVKGINQSEEILRERFKTAVENLSLLFERNKEESEKFLENAYSLMQVGTRNFFETSSIGFENRVAEKEFIKKLDKIRGSLNRTFANQKDTFSLERALLRTSEVYKEVPLGDARKISSERKEFLEENMQELTSFLTEKGYSGNDKEEFLRSKLIDYPGKVSLEEFKKHLSSAYNLKRERSAEPDEIKKRLLSSTYKTPYEYLKDKFLEDNIKKLLSFLEEHSYSGSKPKEFLRGRIEAFKGELSLEEFKKHLEDELVFESRIGLVREEISNESDFIKRAYEILEKKYGVQELTLEDVGNLFRSAIIDDILVTQKGKSNEEARSAILERAKLFSKAVPELFSQILKATEQRGEMYNSMLHEKHRIEALGEEEDSSISQKSSDVGNIGDLSLKDFIHEEEMSKPEFYDFAGDLLHNFLKSKEKRNLNGKMCVELTNTFLEFVENNIVSNVSKEAKRKVRQKSITHYEETGKLPTFSDLENFLIEEQKEIVKSKEEIDQKVGNLFIKNISKKAKELSKEVNKEYLADSIPKEINAEGKEFLEENGISEKISSVMLHSLWREHVFEEESENINIENFKKFMKSKLEESKEVRSSNVSSSELEFKETEENKKVKKAKKSVENLTERFEKVGSEKATEGRKILEEINIETKSDELKDKIDLLVEKSRTESISNKESSEVVEDILEDKVEEDVREEFEDIYKENKEEVLEGLNELVEVDSAVQKGEVEVTKGGIVKSKDFEVKLPTPEERKVHPDSIVDADALERILLAAIKAGSEMGAEISGDVRKGTFNIKPASQRAEPGTVKTGIYSADAEYITQKEINQVKTDLNVPVNVSGHISEGASATVRVGEEVLFNAGEEQLRGVISKIKKITTKEGILENVVTVQANAKNVKEILKEKSEIKEEINETSNARSKEKKSKSFEDLHKEVINELKENKKSGINNNDIQIIKNSVKEALRGFDNDEDKFENMIAKGIRDKLKKDKLNDGELNEKAICLLAHYLEKLDEVIERGEKLDEVIERGEKLDEVIERGEKLEKGPMEEQKEEIREKKSKTNEGEESLRTTIKVGNTTGNVIINTGRGTASQTVINASKETESSSKEKLKNKELTPEDETFEDDDKEKVVSEGTEEEVFDSKESDSDAEIPVADTKNVEFDESGAYWESFEEREESRTIPKDLLEWNFKEPSFQDVQDLRMSVLTLQEALKKGKFEGYRIKFDDLKNKLQESLLGTEKYSAKVRLIENLKGYSKSDFEKLLDITRKELLKREIGQDMSNLHTTLHNEYIKARKSETSAYNEKRMREIVSEYSKVKQRMENLHAEIDKDINGSLITKCSEFIGDVFDILIKNKAKGYNKAEKEKRLVVKVGEMSKQHYGFLSFWGGETPTQSGIPGYNAGIN